MISASDTLLVDRNWGFAMGTTARMTASQLSVLAGSACRGDVISPYPLSNQPPPRDTDATGDFEQAVARVKKRTGKDKIDLQEAIDEMRNPQ